MTNLSALALNEARRIIELNRQVFDGLTIDGQEGQTLIQGGENYYVTDEVEKRNFDLAINLINALPASMGRRVLVVGAGDGALETELLVRLGFDVVAFDLSPGAIEVAKAKFERLGLKADFRVGDVTDLELDQFEGEFAAIFFLQVAAFIPILANDALLNKAFGDLVSLLAHGGVFEFSTTRYPEVLGRGAIDAIYYGRSNTALIEMICKSIDITRYEFFDGAKAYPGATYQNQYAVGLKR